MEVKTNATENGLMIFQNEEFGSVRTVMIDDEPWFVGKDVAEALGFKRTADALSAHVDDEDKNFVKVGEIPTLNVASPRGLYIINESGLYSLILSSKLPNAKKFKRWVTAEVLPALRKTGTYTIQNMSTDEKMQIIAQGCNELKTDLLEVKSVTQDLSTRVDIIEKSLDVLDSAKNFGKKKRLMDTVVAKACSFTDGNVVHQVLWRKNFIMNNYARIKRAFDVARIGQIPASQFDTALEMAQSYYPRDNYIQNKIAGWQGEREKNTIDDKVLIALLQYLRDTNDGQINPFKG